MIHSFTTYFTRNIFFLFLLVTFHEVALGQQCPNAPSGDDGGRFSINNHPEIIKSDGDGALNVNNIPSNFCRGEQITLEDLVTGGGSRSFEITQNATVLSTSNAIPVPSNTNSITTTLPTTPGIYFIKSFGSSGGSGYYACKVIQIVDFEKPKYTVKLCDEPGTTTMKKVTITLLDVPSNKLFDSYTYSITPFGASPRSFNVSTSTYPREITQTINSSILGFDFVIEGKSQYGKCSESDQKRLTTVSTPIVPIIFNVVIDNGISLNVAATAGIEHKIWMRDPISESTYNTTGTPVYTYTPTASLVGEIQKFSVPDPTKQYCFKVNAFDICNAKTVESTNEICTTPLRGDTKQGGNTIIWSVAQGNLLGNTFRSYDVFKVDASGTESLVKTITSIGSNLYDDTDVICGEEYTYKVVTNYQSKSISNLLKLKNTSVPPTPLGKLVSTVIGGQSIRVTSLEKEGNDLPTFTAFNYYRANSINGNYTKVHSGTSAFWDDTSVNPSAQQYCFYMTWTGGCGESQPSSKICPIFAQMQGSSLIWSPESSFTDPIIEYKIFRVNPSTGLPINTSGSGLPYTSTKNSLNLTNLNIPEAEGQTIYLAIEGSTGNIPTTLSNYIEYQRPSLALSAQAFTPNGDGLNDTFYIQGRFIKATKMSIFDRWGNLISFIENTNYQSNPQLGWDGTSSNGNKVPAGSYVFQIQVEDLSGNIITKEGSIVVVY
ncbi:T9SS type B sorting domain-containing protein [Flectobacillus roseus]|uniref:Gliding motility-associated C-terminal domain-containing protein n=1 Tax=Flectobacillus roseus TaxID=502259 RepID=A0ABT6Y6D9_9BACT|nr:gliding motility-associated C-terminal domain-containing protein [Flectobacillus roseus]MDI9859148.1 gliding motility-associated C-terminal domain-containing protein [Flectobacillus roseus]